MPGRKISQMPPSRRRMGWRVRSHSLKSPTTVTSSALGAQTAKRTPGDAFACDQMRAERAVAFVVGAFAVKVQFVRGELRGEAIGIVDLLRLARIEGKAQAVIPRGMGKGRGKKTLGMGALHMDGGVAEDDRSCLCLRQPRANLPIVRAEDENASRWRPATIASMSSGIIDRYYGKNGSAGRTARSFGRIDRAGDVARDRSIADAGGDCRRRPGTRISMDSSRAISG